MRRIDVKIITRATTEDVQKLSESSYKIRLTCAPERGKANKRLIEILAHKFGVSKRDIKIISGERSSRKILQIS